MKTRPSASPSNLAGYARSLVLPTDGNVAPSDATQRARAAEIGAVRGGEIAERLGWSVMQFQQAVATGLIAERPWYTTANGNMYFKAAQADAIVARHKRSK